MDKWLSGSHWVHMLTLPLTAGDLEQVMSMSRPCFSAVDDRAEHIGFVGLS